MSNKRMLDATVTLLVGLLASSMLVSPGYAQTTPETTEQQVAEAPAPAPAAVPAPAAKQARKTSPYRPAGATHRARNYYQAVWGVDNLLVRQTASGNLIRFSYRVTNPERAKALVNRQAKPYLYGQRSQAVLEVPVMDKVGQLRQTGTQDAGQDYWMVFSNKGNLVKSGDRVDVVIGSFRAVGLMVE